MNILNFLLGLFGSSVGSKIGGAVSGITTVGALAGAGLWLFGPGREWQITLNALELSGVVLGGAVLLEWFRRMPPPAPRDWRD